MKVYHVKRQVRLNKPGESSSRSRLSQFGQATLQALALDRLLNEDIDNIVASLVEDIINSHLITFRDLSDYRNYFPNSLSCHAVLFLGKLTKPWQKQLSEVTILICKGRKDSLNIFCARIVITSPPKIEDISKLPASLSEL